MTLHNFLKKCTTCYSLSISEICEEYRGGLDGLMKEEFYQQYKNRKVQSFAVIMDGHGEPELSIDLVKIE